MKQILRLFISVLVVCIYQISPAQIMNSATGCPGVPGACGYHPSSGNPNTLSINPNLNPQNGNGTLGNIYQNTQCGLNYSFASQRLGQRFSPVGVPQPAAFVISGIPACANILKAYVWAEGSGNGAAQTVNVNGPMGSASYPMAVVGSGPDKCWGYSGSYTYRADVTASVNGNGTYNLSGILTNPPTAGNDMDGATLLVVWADPTQTWQGTISIDDGAIVINGGSTTYNMTYPAICGPPTNGSAFMGIGDIQMAVSSMDANLTPVPITWNWWNFEQVATTYTAGQTTSQFDVATSGDCYNLCITGVYFRTTCTTCTPAAALTLNTTATPASCSACNGSATVTVTPAGSYTYSWAPSGGTGPTATNLCAGIYTVTVTAACGSSTQTITVPSAGGSITVANTGVTNVTCNAGCNGTATASPSGGTGPYTYAWSPSGGTGATATNLCAGTYTCDVTDAAGCTGSQTFTISEPPVLTATASGFNISCAGACDGQLSVIPAGGSPNYTFNWNSGCTTASCMNICAGNYTVTVTDNNGCTTTATTTLTAPPAITVSATSTPATCGQSDGSATATFSGGTGTLSPVWYNPATSGATFNNIPAGTYTVIVTDQNNCSDTAFATVANLNGVTASVAATANVTCFGANDGTASVTATGVNTPFTYAWSCSPSTTNSAAGLSAGNCTVTITDSQGCIATVTTTITEPPQLTLTATANPTSVCAGNPIALSATGGGGTPGYQYAWMPGSLIGANQNVTPAASGTYSVYVTDANNCVDSTTVNVTVTSIPVAAFVADTTQGCLPVCVIFTDNSTNASGSISSWAWDFGDGNTSTSQAPSHCYSVPGSYSVTLTVNTNAGCNNTLVMPNYINVFANPVAAFTAGPQPTTELDPMITFTDGSSNASTWAWQFGDSLNSTSNVQNPSFAYTYAGCYNVVLTVTTINGCIDSTNEPICIQPDVSIYVPNAFTPNNDGYNDLFFAQGIGIEPEKFDMWIFDRWGNLLYHGTDMAQGWNGTVQGHEQLVQEDVYVWKIKCIDVNGHKHNLIGRVSVIR